MTHAHPARAGTTFSTASGHRLHVGPDKSGRGPHLFAVIPGTGHPVKLATFNNSTTAEAFIELLQDHFDVLSVNRDIIGENEKRNTSSTVPTKESNEA